MIGLILLVSYFIMGLLALLASVIWNTLEGDSSEDIWFYGIMTALFWPLLVPARLMYYLGVWIAETIEMRRYK